MVVAIKKAIKRIFNIGIKVSLNAAECNGKYIAEAPQFITRSHWVFSGDFGIIQPL